VDPVSRREFWQILYELLRTGMTIFLSTAYMDEAERAHRVGLMHRGRLLIADTPAAIKATFQGELLEVRADDLHAARKILAVQPQVRQVLPLGDRLMVTMAPGEAAPAPLAAALEAGGVGGSRISPAEPALEELFVQIVRREEG
jgi:ABC-2 type transport system ATP-binding protein